MASLKVAWKQKGKKYFISLRHLSIHGGGTYPLQKQKTLMRV